MKKYIILLLFALSTFSQVFAQKQKAKKGLPQHRIVMQLTASNEQVYNGLFKQFTNLKQGWGDSVAITLVAHGPGVDLFIAEKTAHAAAIATAQANGIQFVICENTLRERNIDKASLLPALNFTKMGIAYVVLQQEAGWSYIKAGN